jgi:hypothetical protein
MNRLKTLFSGAALALFLPLSVLYSQTPVLQEIKFLKDGDEITSTGKADIVIQLKFDQAMNPAVAPTINAGLEAPYDIILSFNGQLWVNNNTIWQGPITINDDVPPSDGVYTFKISGAVSAGNVPMNTTLSTEVGNKQLRICRYSNIATSTEALDFSVTAAGTSKSVPVIISNQSCTPLSVSSISTATPFSVTYNAGSFPLSGDSQTNLTIFFAPTQRGLFFDTLRVASNDPVKPTIKISLQGIGVAPEIETDLPSAAIDFGQVDSGVASAPRFVKIYNLKDANPLLDATLVVSSITTTNAAFTVLPTSFNVAPGDSQLIAVTFQTSESRVFQDKLWIYSNDPDESVKEISLSANSTDRLPPVAPNPSTVVGNWYLPYPPYWVNNSTICISWTNPGDPSGIKEVRWKIGNTPPTSGSDTTATQKGDEINAFCFQIPSLFRDGGLYSVYYWLVDGNGNGSTGPFNYASFSYRYDATAPGAPINASIRTSDWTRDDTVSVYWTNPEATPGDFYEVRWKLANRPSSNVDYTGRSAIGATPGGKKVFQINFYAQDCGADSVYFWLADSAGNANYLNPAVLPYKYDKCRPVITRVLDDELLATKNTAFEDTIRITDDAGVDSAWVAYRFGGAEAVVGGVAYLMPRVSGSQDKLEYIVIARDRLGNRYAHGPGDDCDYYDDDYGEDYDYDDDYVAFADDEDAWHAVQVRVTGAGEYRIGTDNNPVTLAAGTDQLSYNLVSLPFILDDGRASTVLTDDLGPADTTKWRFFEYITADQQWQEYPDTNPFEPGRAFFLIVADPGKYIRSGAGTTVTTICPDTLVLEPGWNLIGNPFNFTIDKLESLIPINFLNQLTLYSYERGWNINLTNGMEPWRGYAVYVQPLNAANRIRLVVVPRAINPQSTKSAQVATSADEWTLQIIATAGLAKDQINWMGVKTNAAAEYDENDLVEPPVIGKYVSLYFPHPEWTTLPQNYTADYRPLSNDGYVWDLHVATAKGQESVSLSFEGMSEVPANLEVYLLDEQVGTARNLRQNPSYSFRANANGGKKALRVVAGSRSYVESNSDGVALVPTNFDLAQNFPNPFNPETVIRYAVPEASVVTLEIYNMLGQKVRTLVDHAPHAADFYTVSWNGRDDNGKALATGVYLYRLAAGSYLNTRKMVLMK